MIRKKAATLAASNRISAGNSAHTEGSQRREFSPHVCPGGGNSVHQNGGQVLHMFQRRKPGRTAEVAVFQQHVDVAA